MKPTSGSRKQRRVMERKAILGVRKGNNRKVDSQYKPKISVTDRNSE